MGRLRLILIGAVVGLTWAASLRGFMAVLAGPDSTFTFTGTFGIMKPSLMSLTRLPEPTWTTRERSPSGAFSS
jgi:hypothetical protein